MSRLLKTITCLLLFSFFYLTDLLPMNIFVGVKGGLNIANMENRDPTPSSTSGDITPVYSFLAGSSIVIDIVKVSIIGFSVESGLTYIEQGGRLPIAVQSYRYLHIPILLRTSFFRYAFLNLGLSSGIPLGGTGIVWVKSLPSFNEGQEFSVSEQGFNLVFQSGIGIQIPIYSSYFFSLEVNYLYGLTPIINQKNFRAYTQDIWIASAFHFLINL